MQIRWAKGDRKGATHHICNGVVNSLVAQPVMNLRDHTQQHVAVIIFPILEYDDWQCAVRKHGNRVPSDGGSKVQWPQRDKPAEYHVPYVRIREIPRSAPRSLQLQNYFEMKLHLFTQGDKWIKGETMT